MLRSVFRIRIGWLGVCVALALLLSACSSMTERVLAWYITRKIDSYLDLTSDQEKRARSHVDEALGQLRRSELGRWISLLRELRQGIHDGLSEEDIARLQRHYDARLDAGVQLLVPHVAATLQGLSRGQIDHFEKRMREDLDEQYEELELPPEKRRKAIERRAIKAVEDLVGNLRSEQEDGVRAILRSLPEERSAQYRSAQHNVTRITRFLAKGSDAPAIQAELHAMWQQRYDGLGPGRHKEARRIEQRRALLAVYRMLDAKQRAHAEEELSDRIRMLKRFVIES